MNKDMQKLYKVAVIGAGPGGYETAIRLNQKGIDVILFEKEKIGGECLNWGCIPTKAMVKSADLCEEVKHFSHFGIDIESSSINFDRIMKRKDEVVSKLTTGLKHIFSKRNVPIIEEMVTSISVHDAIYRVTTDKENIFHAEYVVIATGSKPMEIPFLPLDGKYFLSSRDILSLEKLPRSIAIVGGGTIGCEFASILSSLGVKVEIVEMLPSLLSYEDKEIARKLMISFKKRGIKVHVKTKIESAQVENGKVVMSTDKGKTITADQVLVSTGRVPACSIDLSNLQIEQNKQRILINDYMETTRKNIFAIGDVTGELLLAHTASKQGLMVADIIESKINNQTRSVKPLVYANIPRCTFTQPELASIGLTEDQAKEQGYDLLTGKFLYIANGKALATGSSDGQIKVVADKGSRKIIGMHILGVSATELIAVGSVIINTGLTLDDLHQVIYAHPTVSEVIMEAIEDLDNLAIHKI